MFKKKKKTDKEKIENILPEDESEGGLPEPEETGDAPPKPPKKVEKPKGAFSLSLDEMALAVNALANSEEFKIYQQMLIGQQAAEIIAAYNQVVGGKSEEPRDTGEDLPKQE